MEIRIEELERFFKIAHTSSTDNFIALFETRTAMKQAFAALEECSTIMYDCMKNDPEFISRNYQQVDAL